MRETDPVRLGVDVLLEETSTERVSGVDDAEPETERVARVAVEVPVERDAEIVEVHVPVRIEDGVSVVVGVNVEVPERVCAEDGVVVLVLGSDQATCTRSRSTTSNLLENIDRQGFCTRVR
jgi:hypothetical protein